MPHYPRGWAMASNTPFRLYKINTHAGGHTVPFIVSWPAACAGPAASRRQYAHVTDVLPTLLELIGVERPTERHGRRCSRWTDQLRWPRWPTPSTRRPRTEQYYEMVGHRGFYRDGWEVVTRHEPLTPFDDAEWELYDLGDRPDRAPRPRRRAPREGGRAGRGVGGGGLGQPGVSRSTRALPQVPPAPGADAGVQRAGDDLAGTPTLERWRSLS